MSMTSSMSLPAPRSASLSVFAPPVLVGVYLASRLCLTYLFFTSNPQQGAIVSFAINILFLLLAAFYSLGLSLSTTSTASKNWTLRWILAFLSFSLCSLFWSETVSTAIAAAYWLGMAADVAMILLLLRSGDTPHRCEQVIQGYVLGACFVAIVMWLSPTMQDLRPGDDEFFSPNAIGFTCAFGVILAQLLAQKDRVWRYVAAFLAISLLRSLSKTTIAAFVVGELIFIVSDKTLGRRSKLWMLAAAGLVVAAFWNLIAAYYVVYVNAGNQAETLTGRIGIWSFVLERSFERPWFGHGFHSFRNVIPPFGSFEAWHAHNELIQQLYAYGVVGIVLICGLYSSFYRQARRVTHPAQRSLLLGLVGFILVRGLADTERFDLTFPLWSIALLSLMLTTLNHRSEVQA